MGKKRGGDDKIGEEQREERMEGDNRIRKEERRG